MITLCAWILIAVACVLFFLFSDKQLNKLKNNKNNHLLFIYRWSKSIPYTKCMRVIALSFLLLALAILCHQFGISIGVVSLFIFMTPIFLIFILSINDLNKSKN